MPTLYFFPKYPCVQCLSSAGEFIPDESIVSSLGDRFGIRFWERGSGKMFKKTTQVIEEGVEERNNK